VNHVSADFIILQFNPTEKWPGIAIRSNDLRTKSAFYVAAQASNFSGRKLQMLVLSEESILIYRP